jgi:hypothetical protein
VSAGLEDEFGVGVAAAALLQSVASVFERIGVLDYRADVPGSHQFGDRVEIVDSRAVED